MTSVIINEVYVWLFNEVDGLFQYYTEIICHDPLTANHSLSLIKGRLMCII